jgi:hypothetical protein
MFWVILLASFTLLLDKVIVFLCSNDWLGRTIAGGGAKKPPAFWGALQIVEKVVRSVS